MQLYAKRLEWTNRTLNQRADVVSSGDTLFESENSPTWIYLSDNKAEKCFVKRLLNLVNVNLGKVTGNKAMPNTTDCALSQVL